MAARIGIYGFGRMGLVAAPTDGAWYDNERGYVHRLIDIAVMLARTL
jgi:glyceraldehyde-3-phosphate dehydrogenase/erythrose-4-phosphate dehydrogenase